MEENSRPIHIESVAHRVYRDFIDDITEGYFKLGEKLVVRELCERYNVSDTPVKQSLSRLISEGLVENIPRKGMWVKSFTLEELKDMYRARLMIEQYCIDECIVQVKQNAAVKEHFDGIIRRTLTLLLPSVEELQILKTTTSMNLWIWHFITVS